MPEEHIDPELLTAPKSAVNGTFYSGGTNHTHIPAAPEPLLHSISAQTHRKLHLTEL